jgi:hypothetical protein
MKLNAGLLMAFAFATLPVHAQTDDLNKAAVNEAEQQTDTCVGQYAKSHALVMSVTATEVAEAALSSCDRELGILFDAVVRARPLADEERPQALAVMHDLYHGMAIEIVVDARAKVRS